MKKIWPWVASLGIVIMVIGIAYFLMNRPIRDHQMAKIELGDLEMEVEVVNTEMSIMEGLSGRDELPGDGMLFIMPQRQRYGFWMKEMKFALDLVWIADGEVVEITPNVPAPESPDQPLEIIGPQQEVEMVLEIGAGHAEQKGVVVGDKLLIK